MICYVYTWPWQDVIASPHLLKSFLPPCCPWFYSRWASKASSVSVFDERYRALATCSRSTHALAPHRRWWFLYKCPTYLNQPINQPKSYLKMSKAEQDCSGWDIPKAIPIFLLQIFWPRWQCGPKASGKTTSFLHLCNGHTFLDVCWWLVGRVRGTSVAHRLKRIISDSSSSKQQADMTPDPQSVSISTPRILTSFLQSHPFLNGL